MTDKEIKWLQRNCKLCSLPFVPRKRPSKQRYCESCRTKECEVCKRPFRLKDLSGENANLRRFCSLKCRREGKYKNGWKMSEETRAMYCELWKKRKAEKGITDPSERLAKLRKLRASEEVQEWRQVILSRSDFRCAKCSGVMRVEADHILPISLFPNLASQRFNGRSLCRECHKKTSTYAGKAIKKRYLTEPETYISLFNNLLLEKTDTEVLKGIDILVKELKQVV